MADPRLGRICQHRRAVPTLAPLAGQRWTGAVSRHAHAPLCRILHRVASGAPVAIAQPDARGGGALTALVAIIVLLLLLNEAPYRILFKNAAPRVVFESMRCYVTGEDHERLLLYCPDSAAPRTRVVTRSDPTLRWTGIVESIFTPSRDVR